MGEYQIESEDQAAWAMRRRARAAAEAARVRAVWDAQLERLKTERRTLLNGCERDVEFFDGLLADWHARRLGLPEVGCPSREQWDRTGGKTHKLPYGAIRATRYDPRVAVEDDEAFASWLMRNNPDLAHELIRYDTNITRMREVFMSTGGRWYYRGTGELVDPQPEGLTVHEARIGITVSTDDVELPVFDPAPDGTLIPDGIVEDEQ